MLNSRQGTNKSVMRKVRNVSDTLIVVEFVDLSVQPLVLVQGPVHPVVKEVRDNLVHGHLDGKEEDAVDGPRPVGLDEVHHAEVFTQGPANRSFNHHCPNPDTFSVKDILEVCYSFSVVKVVRPKVNSNQICTNCNSEISCDQEVKVKSRVVSDNRQQTCIDNHDKIVHQRRPPNKASFGVSKTVQEQFCNEIS